MSELKTGYKSRAISKNEVNDIRQLRKNIKEGTEQWNACNYFMFGYLGRGINFQDIARLTWDNYSQGVIRFVRFKTRSKIQEETSFTVNTELAEILSWYRKNNKTLHNNYIFPVLNPSYQKESSIHNRIKKVRKQVNSELKKIGEAIESEIPVTTYTWRHSFASVSKNELGVDVAMISESLGHHDLETTKHYLKQFDQDSKNKAYQNL
jgi:integrase